MADTKRKTPHTPGAPVTAWFTDGPLAGTSMTVKADQSGLAPVALQVAHVVPQDALEGEWRPAPTATSQHRTAVYVMDRALDTVPWSYAYRVKV